MTLDVRLDLPIMQTAGGAQWHWYALGIHDM